MNLFMKEAIRLALENVDSGKGGPFGAVIVKDGKIISTGVNSVTYNNDPTAHAEIVAIRKACEALNSFQLTGCEIYSSCEPCPMCLGAIYWARPDKLYFACTRVDAAQHGFDDEFIYKELNKVIASRAIPTHHLMREESLEVFKRWDASDKKVAY
jgi:tRNA(Arg) A34 adenosine deaminase TadA